MSLILDDGPHAVVVYPEVEYVDQRGNAVSKPADVGMLVRGCTVTPVRAERAGDKRRVRNEYRLMTRDAPLGVWSRVEWRGMKLSVVSGPDRVDTSSGTRHVAAVLREER